MKRFPFFLVLLLLVTPLAAREVPVSDLHFGPPPGERTLPSLAEGRNGYLAAWVDERNGTPTVFAARLNTAGVPLERHGIALGDGHDSSRPQVIWNGEAWLVFWSAPNHSLVMSRVEWHNGSASAPRQIAEWAPPEAGRWVATNGNVIVAAHGGSSWGNMDISRVYATVMTMDGEVISSRIVDTRPARSITIVENDEGFALAWNVTRLGGPHDLEAVRLDAQGTAVDTAPRHLAQAESLHEFIGNGDGYVVVFSNFTPEGARYFSFAVDGNLNVVNTPAPVGIKGNESIATAFEDDGEAVLVIEEMETNASHYTVIGFTEDGRESGRRRFVTTDDELGALAVVQSTAGFTAAWIEMQQPLTWKLEGAIFDSELARLTPERALTETAAAEGKAVVAAGTNEMLVASRDAAGVRLRRITYDGARLDLEGIVLTDVALPAPEIVFDGTRYVIAYISASGNDEVVVRFLETNGTLLGEEVRIPVGDYARHLTIARGRSTVAIGWITDAGVHVATLQGTRLANVPRLVAPGIAASLDVAWNGSHYMFAWLSGRLDWDVILYDKILGHRLLENLTAAESAPAVLFELPGIGASELALAARGNGEFVLAYDDRTIEVLRISANLHTLSKLSVATGHSARLASEGDNVVLAWTSIDGVLRAAPVLPEGTLGPEKAAIAPPVPSAYNFGYTSDVALRSGQTVLVYARRAVEAGYVPRVFVNIEGSEVRQPRRRAVR